MPIVASTGGIAGTQSLAVSVRALATRDLTASNARRVILRELGAGLLNGVALAAILGLAGYAIFGDARLGAGARLGDDLQPGGRALGGVLVPLGLSRMGPRPGAGLGHLRDHPDGCDGLPGLPRLCHGVCCCDPGRYQVRGAPRRLCAPERGLRERAGQAAELLADLLADHAGRVLSGYMPMRTEIDPLPAMAAHRGPVGVPVIPGATSRCASANGRRAARCNRVISAR